jgi:hypothetical protein
MPKPLAAPCKVLENVFAEIRQARRYVLDDQAALQIPRNSPTP